MFTALHGSALPVFQKAKSMRKYVTLNRVRLADYECGADGEDYLSRTVYEPEREIIDTGILDAQGNSIFAISETDPIGFVIHGETKLR